jgi:hypothetical protein
MYLNAGQIDSEKGATNRGKILTEKNANVVITSPFVTHFSPPPPHPHKYVLLESRHPSHSCQVLAKFFRQSHHKIPQFGKKFHYFSGFSLLCNKILFWELKEVLFALFLLNKVVFNTPKKILSSCKLVFCFGCHWAF